MPRRDLLPISFGGVGLNTAGRRSWFDFVDGAFNTPEHEPILLQRTGAFPSRVRTQPHEKVLPLNVTFRSKDTEGQARELGRIFNPLLGPQILVVRDLNGIERRMTAEARRIIAVADALQDDRQWTVPLVAARPLWENEALTTFADNLDSGTDPISFTPRNIGNYDASPVFDATGAVTKYATQGYAILREVTYAWRGQLPATGPVTGTWLLEVTDGGIDTRPIIDIAADSQTCTTDITAAQTMPFTVTVGSTTNWEQEGICLASPGGGQEQFEYFVASATTVTLTARALGGTTAVLHSQPFTLRRSHMLEDGRDIAVFIDHKKVPDEKVFIDGIDTATTKIWVEIADIATQQSRAATTGVFDDTDILLETDRHGFAVGDYVVGMFTSGNEKMRITAVNGRTITILRGQHNTTQRAFAVDDRIIKSNHRIQLVYNFSKAAARPTDDDTITPLIDLNLSTNTNWHWLTAGSAALTNAVTASFAGTETERKPGGWKPILYAGSDEVPTNRLAKKTTFRHVSGDARFSDAEPDATEPNFDAVEFVAACGINPVVGIEYDASIGWPFALQVIIRDLIGLDHLLITRLGHEAGDSHEPPTIETNRIEVPLANVGAVILRARNMIVTGIQPADGNEEQLGASFSAEADSQAFVLDAVTRIDGMVVRARESVSGTKLLQMQINEEGSAGPGAAVTPLISHDIAATPTSLREVCEFFASSPVLAAGTYFWVPLVDAGTGTLQVIKSIASLYSRGAHWEGTPFVEIPAEDLWFAILSHLTDNQEDVTIRTRENLDLDAIELVFEQTSPAVNKTPLINLESEEIPYHYNTKWSRGGQDIRVEYLKRQEDVFRSAGIPIASGSYVGDGGGSRSIPGFGFKPEFAVAFSAGGSVYVKGNEDTWSFNSIEWDGSVLTSAFINTFLDDGILFGAGLNIGGVTYYWMAVGGPGLIATGSYTAPGGASGNVTGLDFAPVMVLGFNTSFDSLGVVKTDTMSEDDSCEMGAAAAFVTDEITTLNADGFSFGNGGTMNRNGTDTVYWIAFARADWLQLLSYTGDGVDDRSILAGNFNYAVVMGDRASHKHHKPSGLGLNSQEISAAGAVTADKIQRVLSPGVQVGTAAEVNNNGDVYHLIAFAAQGGLASHPGDFDITIDVLAKTVVDNEFGDDIRQTLLAVSDDWLTIPPGNQVVTIEALVCSAEDEVGARQEEHEMTFRDTWQS